MAEPRLTAANHEWAMDFIIDGLATGRMVRILRVVDAYNCRGEKRRAEQDGVVAECEDGPQPSGDVPHVIERGKKEVAMAWIRPRLSWIKLY
jgi:hypothetical protein